MAHHHKANRAVEGDPGTGHGRGMPERPDDARLAERTAEDRREVADDGRPGSARAGRSRRPAPPPEGTDADIATYTRRLVREAPALPPEQAEGFVHDLYFAAQRARDKEAWEADFERDE